MPSRVVPHYQPCILVWCLTIGDAFSCGASLSALPVGVVPHYRPCLLAWYLTTGNACRSIATATDILLVECRCKKDGVKVYRGAIISDLSADTAPLSDMPVCTVQLYQTCMLGSFIQVRMFVKCCSTRLGIWSATNPSDMHTGRVPLPQVCKIGRLPFWTPS